MSFNLNNISPYQDSEKTEASAMSTLLQKEIIFFGNKISNKIKEDFYTEFSILLSAGVSLKEALELLTKAQKKKTVKSVFTKIIQDLIAGNSLSETIKQRKEFTDYEYYSIKIGEETGTIAQVTQQLGDFFSRKNQQRKEVISALTYPAIVLSTAFLIVIFMLQFVIPMFQDIFIQNKMELPWITKVIISTSEFLKSYGIILTLGLLLLFLARVLFQKKQWYRHSKDRLLSSIPFFGNFIQDIYLSQFTQAIALLSASKVPVVKSIQLVKKMIDFYPLQDALEQVEQQILKGVSLSESLGSQKIFGDKMIALVKVAEQTNQTEFIFARLNTQYHNQLQRQSKMISTIMEPLIILLIGIIVGTILIAMYLPMFKLGTVLGG